MVNRAKIRRTAEPFNMAQLTPRFSSNRTVRKYTEQQYLQAAAAYRAHAAERDAMGRNMVQQMSTRNIMEIREPLAVGTECRDLGR